MKLRWTEKASSQLEALADRSPVQAIAVVHAMEWMAKTGFSLGRRVTGGIIRDQRYWPVPPQGVYYHVEEDLSIVTAVADARLRREPWEWAVQGFVQQQRGRQTVLNGDTPRHAANTNCHF